MKTTESTRPRPFGALFDLAEGPPLQTAIVHPVDALSLSGALQARDAGLITPVLVGPEDKIAAAAETLGVSLKGVSIEAVPHSHAAAARAAQLAGEGQVSAVMKGALHTNELMAALIDKSAGLRTERRMSHVFVLETPAYPRWILVSDGALNIAPDLMRKKDIVQNAIDLAHAIGINPPKVAILSATEEVDPNIPSTLDAACLCKMADRGQIRGGLVDGPLAFDLAVSPEAVRIKGLVSNVAGEADILIVPTLEAGNMIAKQLDYLAGANAAGIVLGAKVPVILTSRADSVEERLASCALAKCFVATRSKVVA